MQTKTCEEKALVGVYPEAVTGADFDPARAAFEDLLTDLVAPVTALNSLNDIEAFVSGRGREVLRQVMQARLDQISAAEPRLGRVVGSDGFERSRSESGRRVRRRCTLGELVIERRVYRSRGRSQLTPLEHALGTAGEYYTPMLARGLIERLVGVSYADAGAAPVAWPDAEAIGSRQAGAIVCAAMGDFDAFCADRASGAAPTVRPLGLSFDAKGIVMIPRSLRTPTRDRGSDDTGAGGHLGSGQGKRGRKRMAQAGAVWDIEPLVRIPEDLLGRGLATRPETPGAKHKRVYASVEADAAETIKTVIGYAAERDPGRSRTWVVLLDGARSQIDAVLSACAAVGVEPVILADLVHVAEYLWDAAVDLWGSRAHPSTRSWVGRRLRQLLEGDAQQVIADLDACANRLGLGSKAPMRAAVRYLTGLSDYLAYDRALAQGWPVATGLIEGAVRYLVCDRLDITGARWGLDGAEAMLRLRALVYNGQLDDYWDYHLEAQRERHHTEHYHHTSDMLTLAALPLP